MKPERSASRAEAPIEMVEHSGEKLYNLQHQKSEGRAEDRQDLNFDDSLTSVL